MKGLLKKRWREHWRKGEDWAYCRVKGAIEKGWNIGWQQCERSSEERVNRLGLLEGERGKRERLKNWLTKRWRKYWRRIEDWALNRVRIWLTKRWKEHWRKGEVTAYCKVKGAMEREVEKFVDKNVKGALKKGWRQGQIFWLTKRWKRQLRKGDNLNYRRMKEAL